MDETKRLLGQQEEMDDGEDRKNTQRGKYMTFKSGPEYFGLEIQYVQQIIQYQSIARAVKVAVLQSVQRYSYLWALFYYIWPFGAEFGTLGGVPFFISRIRR